jgi:hypothetical protein
MKTKDAMRMIDDHERGFMVHFEVQTGSVLPADYFPDRSEGEELITDEEKAWTLAKRFAKAGENQNIVNVYVVNQHAKPVADYKERILNVYPPAHHNEDAR